MKKYLIVDRCREVFPYGFVETDLSKEEVQKIIDKVYMFDDYSTEDLEYLFGRCGIKYQYFDEKVLF